MTNHPIEPHPALVRVAKAISGQDEAGWAAMPADDRERLYGGGKWHEAGHTRADHLADARAALEALRDLPEDVIAAGERAAWDDHNHMPAIRAMPRAVAAMINTIIGESATPGSDGSRMGETHSGSIGAADDSAGRQAPAETQPDRNAGEI